MWVSEPCPGIGRLVLERAGEGLQFFQETAFWKYRMIQKTESCKDQVLAGSVSSFEMG